MAPVSRTDGSRHQDLFFEIFDPSLPRLGPGEDAATIKALDLWRSARFGSPESPAVSRIRILDIGCGNGAQTLALASQLDASILALDNHQPFLDELERRARSLGVGQKIQICLKDMNDLNPDDGPFDLIWSEGALYILGFHQGLALCHSLLTKGGGLGVTELCWLKSDPPGECRQYFANAYPAMAGIGTHLSAIENLGLEILGHFVLSESAWWGPYYRPLEERLRSMRAKYASDRERLKIIENVQLEIDLYRNYSEFYGYVFFVMLRR